MVGAIDPHGLESVVLWGGPALIGIGAAVAGAHFKGRRQPVLALVVVVAGLVALVVAAMTLEHDPDVTDAAYIAGLALAGALLAALPFAVYYLLGRRLGERPVLLGFVVLLTLVPLGVYTFFAVIVSIGFVGCPPDAYECPL